jgi:hypothetical protein
MSVEQRKIIDFVGVDEEANEVILTISDHLEWDNPKSDHLLLLQDKINDYLAFIESGELLRISPYIDIRLKFPYVSPSLFFTLSSSYE